MKMLIPVMMMMVMVVVVMVKGQDPWPTVPLATAQQGKQKTYVDVALKNQQNEYQEFFFVDPSLVPKGLYNQLFVTKEEASQACRESKAAALVKSGRGGATAPHPRCCFAYLVCAGEMFNPVRRNTTYVFTVQVMLTSPGTYYDPTTFRQERWGPGNNCAADPCKTNKPMTDGRSCQTYTTCEQNSEGKIDYKRNSCPDKNGFSVILNRCAPDDKCKTPEVVKTENVRCYATGRPAGRPAIPGVPDEAYYNRTFRIEKTGEEVTVAQLCAASLVFDPDNVNSTQFCRCVKPAEKKVCNITLINAGHGTPQPWQAAVNFRDFTFTVDDQGATQGWARFQRNRDFNYYDAQALAENELSGDWFLWFRYQLDPAGDNPGTFALVQNTHDPVACPTPSLRISVVDSSSLRAEVIPKNSDRAFTVSLDNILRRGVNEPMEVMLERSGDSITLRARARSSDPYRDSTVTGLGKRPLQSTRCGLVFGDEFSGWIEAVRLQKKVC